MGKVNESHHSEDERQPGRNKEQKKPVLQPIQAENKKKCEGHGYLE
jgi:hypothetical protein